MRQTFSMGFLDNLESSLKSLESQDERDGAQQSRREAERAQALGVAPWVEKLKTGSFTQKLFEEAAIAGHRLRAKIYVAWIDRNLRLELRGHSIELRPTPTGVVAHSFAPDGTEEKTAKVDLTSDPKGFLEAWIGSLPVQTPAPRDEKGS